MSMFGYRSNFCFNFCNTIEYYFLFVHTAAAFLSKKERRHCIPAMSPLLFSYILCSVPDHSVGVSSAARISMGVNTALSFEESSSA